MNICSLQDASFDFGVNRELSLFVMFRSSGFVFAVFEPQTSKYYCLFEEKMDESVDFCDFFLNHCNENRWLSLEFKQSFFVYETPNFIIHPEKLLSYTNEQAFSMQQFFCNAGNTSQTNKLLNENITIQFDIDVVFQSLLDHKFGNCRYCHISELFLKYHLKYQNKLTSVQFQLYRGVGFLLVMILKNGRIELFNTYPCNSDADLIYYVSLLYKTFETKDVEVSGAFDINGDAMQNLKKVFNIKKTFFSMDYNYMFSISDIDQSQYSTIINQTLCE